MSASCSTEDAANYLIDGSKKNIPIHDFVLDRILHDHRTDLWKIIELIHGDDLKQFHGCTGTNYYNLSGEQRIALCELSDWVEELLIQLNNEHVDLSAQGVPVEVCKDIIQQSN